MVGGRHHQLGGFTTAVSQLRAIGLEPDNMSWQMLQRAANLLSEGRQLTRVAFERMEAEEAAEDG